MPKSKKLLEEEKKQFEEEKKQFLLLKKKIDKKNEELSALQLKISKLTEEKKKLVQEYFPEVYNGSYMELRSKSFIKKKLRDQKEKTTKVSIKRIRDMFWLEIYKQDLEYINQHE